MFHVKHLYVERLGGIELSGRFLFSEAGQLLEQRPGDLLVLPVVEHRVEVAECHHAAPERAAGLSQGNLAAVRASQRGGRCRIGRDQTERVEPLHQQEQRLVVQPFHGGERARAASVSQRSHRAVQRCSAALAQGASARYAHERQARPIKVLVEQLPRFVESHFVHVTIRRFFHTIPCGRDRFAV